MSGELVVSGERLRPAEILSAEHLYSRTETLGDSGRPRLVREGDIVFGDPVVYRISLDEYPALVRQRPEIREHTFVLLEIPFDLEPLSGSRTYQRLDLVVELDTAGAVARSLWPTLVADDADVERCRVFGLLPDLSLGHPLAGPATATFRYVDLRAEITGSGVGRSPFSWRFTPRPGAGLTPVNRRVFAVVHLPDNADTVSGTLLAEATVSRRVLDVFESVTARTSSRSFAHQLHPAAATSPGRAGRAGEPGTAPRVFVSYAHDSPEHQRQVIDLATFLVERGLDVRMDSWADSRRVDWSSWAVGEITDADFVLVIASPAYGRTGDGLGPPTENRGVQSESALLRDLLHEDRRTWTTRLIPVILPGNALSGIPHFLSRHTATHYWVTEISDAGAESLLRVLTRQPARVRPPLGRIPTLPPD